MDINIIPTQILVPDEENIKKVCHTLLNDDIAALPTETVYGLAGLSDSETALLKIFESKERPLFDPLIAHIPYSWINESKTALEKLSSENLLHKTFLQSNEAHIARILIKSFWPGPLTLVLPKNQAVLDLVTSGLPHIALRCPSHPVFQKILEELQKPLCAPSANRFGKISPTNAQAVLSELSGKIPFILDGGDCAVGIESTVCFIHKNSIQILRPGSITVENIKKALIKNHFSQITVQYAVNETNSHASPGLLNSHYAPNKKLYLLGKEKIPTGSLSFNLILLARSIDPTPLLKKFNIIDHPKNIFYLSEKNTPNEIAKNLFQTLRSADETTSDIILCQSMSSNQDGLLYAIKDRLKKAAYKTI